MLSITLFPMPNSGQEKADLGPTSLIWSVCMGITIAPISPETR